jgi:HAD superfamily hydrolase (TIGR01509 family)
VGGHIRGVIFDMDGTITVPVLDFRRIRVEMGIGEGRGVLEMMSDLDGAERARAEETLLRHELAAAHASRLNEGVEEALGLLRVMGIKTGILTRNCRQSADIVIAAHGLEFDAVVTREDCLPKPDPDGVRAAARRMGVAPDECLVVGDYEYDVRAGRAAGAVTVLFSTDGRTFDTEPDFQIRSMAELPGIVRDLNGA